MMTTLSLQIVRIIEPIIQHADWFFPGGETQTLTSHSVRLTSVTSQQPQTDQYDQSQSQTDQCDQSQPQTDQFAQAQPCVVTSQP